MKVRRTARQTILTFAAAILPLVLGCGGDDGTDTDENPLVGSWGVTSVLEDDVEIFVGTGATVNFTFNSDLTYSAFVSNDTNELFCGTTDCTEDGTYMYTSTNLFICDPGCDEPGQYTITGDTLVLVIVDEDADPDPVTLTITFGRILT